MTEYILLSGNFSQTEELSNLNFLRPDSNLAYFGQVGCQNNIAEKGKMYYNGDLLVYVFDNFTIVLGYTDNANGCDLPFNTRPYAFSEDSGIASYATKSQFESCYGLNLTSEESYGCFISDINRCNNEGTIVNYCYYEIAYQVRDYNYSKALEFCEHINSGNDFAYLKNQCRYQIALVASNQKIEDAIATCDRIKNSENTDYYGYCITDIATYRAKVNLTQSLELCNKLVVDREYCMGKVTDVETGN